MPVRPTGRMNPTASGVVRIAATTAAASPATVVVLPSDATVPTSPDPGGDGLDRGQLPRQQHPGLGEVRPEHDLGPTGAASSWRTTPCSCFTSVAGAVPDGADLGADLTRR